nr:hypothetical protein [candidate division Zixibacteria bacterium]
MMRLIIITTLLLMAVGVAAQDFEQETAVPTPLIRRPGLPTVTVRTDNKLLMWALYPEDYINEYNLQSDIRWVNRNDSEFVAEWDSIGITILAMIEDLSGIKWRESQFDINLTKYLRTAVMYDPPALPLQGIRMNHYTEAVPTGLHRLLNVIKLVAGRNLLQTELPGCPRQPVADHPLLDKSAYRFDIMVLTLSLACAEYIIPSDSLENILKTEHWQKHNPGWEIYKNHFRYSWMISFEEPLITFILREPYDSPLVGLTRPPRPPKKSENEITDREPIRLSAGSGRLGFSVARLPNGFMEIIDVDTLGLAYTNGLMIGDQIKRVNNEVVHNAHDLMEKILDKIDREGVYLIVIRNGEEVGLLMLPRLAD